MASGHPLILKQRQFAAAAETVAGTAVALAAANARFVAFDPKIDYEVPPNVRQSPGSLSKLTQVPGVRKANVTLKTEVMGSGTVSNVPLWATTLLAASGFVNTAGTFAPVSGSATADTLTCGVYIDGLLKTAAGCMFNWTMTGQAGNPLMIDWTGEGVYVAPTDTALLTAVTYPTVLPPRFASATLTIGGTAYTLSEIEIACNNVLYTREDASVVNGLKACCITDRDFTVKVNPEYVLLATKNFFVDLLASTEVALSVVLGSGSNQVVTISCPKLQLREAPTDGERNGVYVQDLLFQASKNSASGDDEITIAFS